MYVADTNCISPGYIYIYYVFIYSLGISYSVYCKFKWIISYIINHSYVVGGTYVLALCVSCLFCRIRLIQCAYFTHVTWPNLWYRSCSKCYAMDCFGTYFTHVQTCDNVRVQSATQWTASVHTLHMSKPVIAFVFKVLRNGLLRYILYTWSNLW